MKKLLAILAMLTVATTLFAEDGSISCESDLGKCTFTLSADSFSKECTCRDGSGVGESELPSEGGTLESTLPTEEECKAEIEDFCGNAGIRCENNAGECEIEADGNYDCRCFGLMEITSGNIEASEKACNSKLVELCGTEPATAKTLCTDSEIFNECLTYAKSFTNTCYEPMTDEEIEAALDLPAETSNTTAVLAFCCQSYEMKEEFKTSYECVEAAESCENGECCDTCDVFVLEESNEKDDDEVISPAPDDSADAGDTEVPAEDATGNADGSDAPADGDDSAPATDSESSAEKEESKSDGCSMLFI
ncbi:hypothetical protein J6W78_07335 [bacterium]|nr:hypothetical protein [bacterium]